jgi:endonuclease IV
VGGWHALDAVSRRVEGYRHYIYPYRMSEMPRIGFSVWKDDSKRIKDLIPNLLESGYDHVEVSIESPLDTRDPDLLYLISTLRDAGLSIGFHAPWKEIFPASPVEEIRLASTNVLAKVLENILKFEPTYLVLHGSSEQNICLKNEDTCIGSLEISVETLRKIYGEIYIETIQGLCCGKISQILKLIEKIQEPRVCLDLAHIAVESIIKARNKWPSRISDTLSEIPERLGRISPLIHIHGLKSGDRRVRTHYDFSYTPLGGEDIARAAKMWGVRYIVFEVFYRSSGEPVKPSDLYEEVKRIRGWISILS